MTMSRARALKRHAPQYHPWAQAHALAALRRRATWFKPPAPQVLMTAGRVEINGEARPELFVPESRGTVVSKLAVVHKPGTYEWARLHAHESATAYIGLHLHRPTSSLNHRTARFAGKPYHWRQDYTGQLRLAAGESPW